jgi:hypothetical protein
MRGTVRLLGSTVVVLSLLAASEPVRAEQYGLAATAGGNGDAHTSNQDAVVFASGGNGINELYEASADLVNGGSFSVSASASAPGPVLGGAGVSIQETIHIDETPSGPITIHLTFGAEASAAATGGFANASATAELNAFAGGKCTSQTSYVANVGPSDLSSCVGADGSASSAGLSLTVTPEQLAQTFYEIYLTVNASVSLEGQAQLQFASGTVNGGAGTLLAKRRTGRGSEPLPGIIYLEFDPPIAHSFTGPNTFFPAPEPGAPLLAAVGAAVLAAFRRRSA